MIKFEFHRILFSLFLLLFLCSRISCKKYTIEEVVKSSSTKCMNDGDCPAQSHCVNRICDISFYCHDYDCIQKTDEMSFDDSITKDNYLNSTTSDLIMESCPMELRNMEKCFTRYCTNSSNCYSNLCRNNTCIINDMFTTYYCTLNEQSTGYFCGRATFEKCNKNRECYSEICNGDHICVEHERPYIFFILSCFIIIFGVLIAFGAILFVNEKI